MRNGYRTQSNLNRTNRTQSSLNRTNQTQSNRNRISIESENRGNIRLRFDCVWQSNFNRSIAFDCVQLVRSPNPFDWHRLVIVSWRFDRPVFKKAFCPQFFCVKKGYTTVFATAICNKDLSAASTLDNSYLCSYQSFPMIVMPTDCLVQSAFFQQF